MKQLLLFIILGTGLCLGQRYQGQIIIGGKKSYYVEQIFISNLSQTKDYLLQKQNIFDIPAKVGDVIRFSGLKLESKEIIIGPEMLNKPEQSILIDLKSTDIEAIVLNKKLTGNLKTDVSSIKTDQSAMQIQNMLNLPEAKPKQNYQSAKILNANTGNPILNALLAPLAGLNPEALYQVLSGNDEKKRQLFNYEKNMNDSQIIQNYFGDDYFIKQGLKSNQIKEFLQYLYLSEDLKSLVFQKNFMAIEPLFEKHLPIFLKRLSERKNN